MGVVNWSALPLDLIPRIADLLLSDDPIDLLCFRAVCRVWRSLSPDPRSLASRFRPRRWIMLSDGGANLTVPQTFLNLSTGRSLHISLPDLYGHSILTSTDGLLLLVHEETFLVRLFNPFTRLMVDLPPLPHSERKYFQAYREHFRAAMSCSDGTDDNPTVVLSWERLGPLLWAKPGDQTWSFKSLRDFPGFQRNPPKGLFFEGSFYVTMESGHVWSMSLDCNLLRQLVCPDWQLGWDNQVKRAHLVECDSTVLLVREYYAPRPSGVLIEVYKADLDNNRLVLAENIGDYALFVGPTRTLSVSAKDFPSIRGNSIYLCTQQSNDSVVIYDLEYQQREPIPSQSVLQIIDNNVLQSRPSVQPFTLPDHLITYCSNKQWAKGLMYHEFPTFPRACFIRLLTEIKWGISQSYLPIIRFGP